MVPLYDFLAFSNKHKHAYDTCDIHNRAIPLLDIKIFFYPQKAVYKNIIVTLYIIAKEGNNLKCLSIEKRIHELYSYNGILLTNKE